MKKYLLVTIVFAGLVLGGFVLFRGHGNDNKAMAKPVAAVSAEKPAAAQPKADPEQAADAEKDSEPELEDVTLDGPYERLLIKPKSDDDEKKLRELLNDTRHEFEGKFTANVPESLLNEVKTLADVERVPVYEIASANSVCGNGIAEDGEECAEPELNCDEGDLCEKCQCKKNDKHFERLCEPKGYQAEYNVTQVNGGNGGAGITVAVVDTGAYTEHLDLADRIKVCKDFTKRGVRNGCEDDSSIGHGTHAAGVVAADGGKDKLGLFGVAPGADLMILKACAKTNCYADDIAAAIDYAAKRGANIVSMSFSSITESDLMEEAIERNSDMLYVGAAGNYGPVADSVVYPAAYSTVIGVGAISSSKIVMDFSSRGIDDDDDENIVDREIEFVAGGDRIKSTHSNGCYNGISGTSLAAPTIAGLAAKVWQESASATREYLVTIAQDITQADGGGAEVGFDTASGYGLPVAP